MSTLSREQVEQLCERIRKEITWKHEIGYILDTDAALRDQVARLTAALMAVEWSDGQSQVCQWCKSDIYEGHRMNCLRQQVLREQVTL